MARQLDLEKREAILEAAFTAFGESGYQNTTIKDIATGAGIAPGSVYTYFEDKEDLFKNTVYEGLHTFHEEMLRIYALPEPFDVKFNLVIDFGFELFKKVHPLFRGIFSDTNRMNLIKEHIDRLSEVFEGLFLEGARQGAIRIFNDDALTKSAVRIFIAGILFHTSLIPRDDLDIELDSLKEQLKMGLTETLNIGLIK